MRVLLTGGAGFIGSHTAVALLQQGHEVSIVDDLSNSHMAVLDRIFQITGKRPEFMLGDAACVHTMENAFKQFQPEAVIHFAGLKAVGESTKYPLRYYQVNLGTLLTTVQTMIKHNVRKLVFSSSATVYTPAGELLKETDPTGLDIPNAYGRTKAMIEAILEDVSKANPELEICLLRYFNPVGAHPSGLIGEDPADIPNNLVPFISQVAVGIRERLNVFGNDYPTPDGTGVRDYIHVLDLADAHLVALENSVAGVRAVNVGTGSGSSVLEVLHAYEKVVGHELPYQVTDRRPGDSAVATADPSLAKELWGWSAKHTLEEACQDAHNWQSKNPRGYLR